MADSGEFDDSNRRKSLDRHSSNKATVVIDDDQPVSKNHHTDETKQNKAFGFMSMFKKPVEIQSSNAFSWISSLRSEKVVNANLNLENLDKITSPSEAVAALKQSMDVKTDEYFCTSLDLITHLCEQDATKLVATELGSLGACGLIDQILGLKITSSPCCECCLRAMCSLITPPDVELVSSLARYKNAGGYVNSGDHTAALQGVSSNCKKLSSSGTIYRIIKGAHTHIADAIVLEWGLRVVHYISLEEGMLPKLLACGGCDLLTKSIHTHPSCSDVLVWVCRDVSNFVTCDGSAANGANNTQDKFGDCGVCEALCSTVLAEHGHEINESAAVWVLQAVGSLARRHANNKTRLRNAGICTTLPLLYRRFQLDNKLFSEAVCWAVGNLCFPDADNQSLLGEAGAGEIVCRSLTQHIHSAIVVQEGLRALRNLCHYHDANMQLLFTLGVVDAVMAVLRQFRETHSEVMQWVWYAVATLADHPDSLLELGRQGITSAVVGSINRFSDQEDLVQWAALATNKLAANDDLSVQLGVSQSCQAITASLSTHLNSEDVAEELLNAIGTLCSHNPANVLAFSKGEVCGLVVRALVRHEKTDSVVEAGLFAVMNLIQRTTVLNGSVQSGLSGKSTSSFESDELLLRSEPQHQTALDTLVSALLAAQAPKVVSKVLARHAAESEYVAEYGCRVLCDLMCLSPAASAEDAATLLVPSTAALQSTLRTSSSLNLDTLKQLHSGGAATALCVVLQHHLLNTQVLEPCLLAMERLCSFDRNIAQLRSGGVCELLMKALTAHYQHSESIVDAAYRLGAHLCMDDLCRDQLGSASAPELVVASLSLHLHSMTAAQQGCDFLSALCLSPAQDAVASIIAKESANTTQANKAQAIASIDWISFDVNNIDHLNILAHSGSAAGSDTTTSAPSSKSIFSAENKTADSFFSWGGGKTAQASTGFESLTDAASNLISVSAGLSDQEEALIAAKQSALYGKRSNNERLHKAHVNALLASLLHTHVDNETVLIAVANAVNSLAMHPLNRAALSGDGIFELLAAAYTRCIRDSGSSSGDAATRRLLTITLNVALGSLCLPESSSDSSKAGNAIKNSASSQNADKLPFLNQQALGALNMCQYLTECLAAAGSDLLMQEVVLRAMYYLALSHEGNQASLGSVQCHQLVVRALKEQMDQPKIVYYACLTISALAHNHRGNSTTLGQENVCEAVVASLNRYINNEDVAEACCHAVYGLKALNHLLGKAGACECVLQTLTLHPTNATVAQWVCRAIGTLAEHEANKVELDKHGVCKTVTLALQKHVSSDSLLSTALFLKDTSSAGVAQWGCTAIYYIAKDQDTDLYQNKLVAAGACEAVAKALVKYSEVEAVSYCCCRTLVVLLMNNAAYKAKLGGLGVCACIVESMHLYPSSVLIAKWGCRAVAVLAEGSDANIARLGMAGGCETIPVILQAHQNSEHVAGAGCDVIAFMAEVRGNAEGAVNAGFAARFGHAGGCEAVVSVLRKHIASSSVVSRAAIALSALAKDKGNSAWLGPTGAAEALYAALQYHSNDVTVCKFVISAIGNLCIIENNKERLGAIGTCELVVRVFNQHINDLETAKAAGLTVGKLCEQITRLHEEAEASSSNSSPTEDSTPAPTHHRKRPNRAALFEAGGCEAIVVAINNHLTDAAAANILCRTISILAFGRSCSPERTKLGALGACKAVTNAIQFHEGIEEVAKCGCLAVKALASRDPANQQILHDCGICHLVIVVLRGYRYAASGPAVVEAAAWAIGNLATDFPQNKQALGVAGGCEGLLEVLELHSRNPETSYLILKALFHVCDGSAANRLKICFSGAADILHGVLLRYLDDERIVEFVYSAMIGMCLDKVGQSRLGTVGACKTVVASLYRFEKSSEYLSLLCCALIAALANGSVANQNKLANSGACKAVVSAMKVHMHSTSAEAPLTAGHSRKSSSADLLSASGGEETRSRDADKQVLADRNTGGETNTSLSALIPEFSVLQEGCKAVTHLAAANEANRQKFLPTGVVDILTTMLSSSYAAKAPLSQPQGAVQVSEGTKDWAKQAMDVLIGKTYA